MRFLHTPHEDSAVEQSLLVSVADVDVRWSRRHSNYKFQWSFGFDIRVQRKLSGSIGCLGLRSVCSRSPPRWRYTSWPTTSPA